MQVPFVDLIREYQEISDEVDAAIGDVLKRGYFVQGEEVKDFEKEFATYVSAKQGIGVNSGSDALTLALRALEVGAGDEVITVSHTFVSTANAIVKNGARPVFVDVDPDTLCMDPDQVAEAITTDTEAIIPVHLYGHPVEMDPIVELASEHDLAIVEDASQAHGATYKREKVGSIGDIGCFSLYPTKNLGAYGDGGIAVTDDDTLAEKLRSLRNYGRVDKYQYDQVENHSRLDELQAAPLREKLTHLDEWNGRRQWAAEMYRDQLSETRAIPQSVSDCVEHVYHLFVVQHPERDTLRQHLTDAGIDSLVHYPVPVHQQPAYDSHNPRHALSETEKVVSEIVSLPLHPWLREEEIKTVVNRIREFNTK